MSNNHHEDERYAKFYNRTPHGEVPSDERVRLARDGGTDPVDAATADAPTSKPGIETAAVPGVAGAVTV